MDTEAMWYIGKAAEKTGASPKAIRLYEKMKLIPAPERKGNYGCIQKNIMSAVAINRFGGPEVLPIHNKNTGSPVKWQFFFLAAL